VSNIELYFHKIISTPFIPNRSNNREGEDSPDSNDSEERGGKLLTRSEKKRLNWGSNSPSHELEISKKG